MTRKIVDCRTMPSDTHCTLAITGEEDEVIEAAAAHAVAVHGHTDGEELRASLRAQLRDETELSAGRGAFVQLIEYRTRRIDEIDAAIEQWAESIGGRRTGRWAIRTADRDRPDTYVEIVEFPDYESAMLNSKDEATTEFSTRLGALCEGERVFRNLDVRDATTFQAH